MSNECAPDWSFLEDEEVDGVARQVAIKAASKYAIEFDDAYQDSLIFLATKPDLYQPCCLGNVDDYGYPLPPLGLGILYARLLRDVADKHKADVAHRKRTVSYEEARDSAGPDE